MEKQNRGQVLVDVVMNEKLLKGLLLPGYLKTLVSKNCSTIQLVDWRLRRYAVCIEDSGYNNVKINGKAEWSDFVNNSLNPDTIKLFLKCIRRDTFEVSTFNSGGLEIIDSGRGTQFVKRCISLVTEQSYSQQVLSFVFLDTLREERLLKPKKRVRIVGSRQAEDVEVIWEFLEDMERKPKEEKKGVWLVNGFHGSKWTNLCFENNVEEDSTLMFTFIPSLELFTMDVFNKRGVGLGRAVAGNERAGSSESEAEGVDGLRHKCRIKKHKCKLDSHASFITFQYHSLTTHKLTLPKGFVRDNRLHTYLVAAALKFGRMKFQAGIEIKIDPRDVSDKTHVVLTYDWTKFSTDTGIVVGEVMKFQVMENKCVPGEVVYFDVC